MAPPLSNRKSLGREWTWIEPAHDVKMMGRPNEVFLKAGAKKNQGIMASIIGRGGESLLGVLCGFLHRNQPNLGVEK
jgi:hypothetical protein